MSRLSSRRLASWSGWPKQGLSLTGPDGLLKLLTKTVIETALNEEMTEHLGYEQHDPAGRESGNLRNGSRGKSVLTETTGSVEIDVPRDRAGTFEPQIVRKRQRRLNGVDEVVLSLYSKGLTTGEISAHFAEIYGASVSKETISRITDKVIEEMNDWAHRPLDEIYAAIFINAIVVKVRDGQVAGRPCSVQGVLRHAVRLGHRRAVHACSLQHDQREPRRPVGYLRDGRRELGELLRPGRGRACCDRTWPNSSAQPSSSRSSTTGGSSSHTSLTPWEPIWYLAAQSRLITTITRAPQADPEQRRRRPETGRPTRRL